MLSKCLSELKILEGQLDQNYFYEVAKSWEDLVTAEGILNDEKLGRNDTLLEGVVAGIEVQLPAFRGSHSYQRNLTLSNTSEGKKWLFQAGKLAHITGHPHLDPVTAFQAIKDRATDPRIDTINWSFGPAAMFKYIMIK